MLKSVLKNFGLNEKEAQVYLTLLELGTASAFNISKKSKISHSTTYSILERLLKDGLISKFEQQNTTNFVAEPPSKLIKIIEQKKEYLNKQEQEIKNSFSELSAIYSLSQAKPRVRLYEGLKSIEDIENDADDPDRVPSDTIYSFVSLDMQNKLVSSSSIANRRLQRGQKIKMIYTHKDGMRHLTNLKLLREARFLSRDKFPFNSSLVISPNHSVRLFSYRKNFVGIWIDDPDIANTLKVMFDICWLNAQKEK